MSSTEIARDVASSAHRDTLSMPLYIRAAAVGAARAEQHRTYALRSRVSTETRAKARVRIGYSKSHTHPMCLTGSNR